MTRLGRDGELVFDDLLEPKARRSVWLLRLRQFLRLAPSHASTLVTFHTEGNVDGDVRVTRHAFFAADTQDEVDIVVNSVNGLHVVVQYEPMLRVLLMAQRHNSTVALRVRVNTPRHTRVSVEWQLPQTVHSLPRRAVAGKEGFVELFAIVSCVTLQGTRPEDVVCVISYADDGGAAPQPVFCREILQVSYMHIHAMAAGLLSAEERASFAHHHQIHFASGE
jgi:hypothetical protein